MIPAHYFPPPSQPHLQPQPFYPIQMPIQFHRPNQKLTRYDSFTLSLDQLLENSNAQELMTKKCAQSSTSFSEDDEDEESELHSKDITSEVGSLGSSNNKHSSLQLIDEEIANFVEKLENSDGERGRREELELERGSIKRKRPYFRRAKYAKEIVQAFEAKKRVQKRERNRVLAAESRRRQKERLCILEEENSELRQKLEHILKRLRLYEDVSRSY